MGTATATAPWKQLLLNALESNSHLKHSSYLQLATIGSNGRPSNRTVVFRGFEENSDKIQIHTDRRSRKIEELRHCPFAEFRINGRVEVIDEMNPDSLKREQREKAWFSCSMRSRLQYLGPSPGVPRLNEDFPAEASVDPSTGPVGAFCLLVLEPDQVDYLNLKSNQRLEFTFTRTAGKEKCWTSERINP
ncbi:hypothetical protein CDL15_Pgr023594 [Punica granatum]|uniref:pyridoxal 5'-phosphate synthase n=1 Tax=Punica granatum TaxID=22663 RepID=A0A218W816_PUNGR|nr:hypothetical protein CDL15_Pgr023594 [Punica granatum]